MAEKPPPRDIAQILGKYVLTSRETREEIRSRLKIAEDDASHRREQEKQDAEVRRQKELASYRDMRLGAGLVLATCLLIVAFPWIDIELKKLAFGLISTIIAAGFGYVKGQESRG